MKKLFDFFGQRGHNCRDMVDQLELMLDGELDPGSEQKLINELKRCPSCLERYDIDKAFKRFLYNKMERKCCAERTKVEILAKIRNINS